MDQRRIGRFTPVHRRVTFPVRDKVGGILASITINGPVLTGAEPSNTVPRLLEIRAELETFIQTDSDGFRSPYAHFDPDHITIQLLDEKP